MNSLALAVRQVRYENTAFWRNPVSAFFVFFFPLIFLVLFNLIFGSREMELPGGIVNTSTFYVPAIVAMSVIYTCYSNVAIGMSFSREQGLLKRTRGTPLPAWSFLFGRIVHSLLLAVILVVIVTAAGVLVYDVDVPTNTLPAALISLGVGAAAFCALGLATTAVIPNAESSPAIVNVSVLPLLFISDVFIPLHDAPSWLTRVADLFPVRHFAQAMHNSFDPFETGTGLDPVHLLVMAAWMVVGLVVALRYFSWEPRN